MSEAKLISPMLDGFVIGGSISEHHGINCYPAMPENSDKRYIVKVISIPASQVQLDALLLAGAYSSKESALAYFKELADGISAEADVLKKMSRFEGFIPFDDLQIVPKDDDTGYDVYLLGTYKRSLERHMKKTPMTHLNAVNLGLDLCASMVVSRRMGYLYVDLKPSNIFINDKQEFRIGDLGFLKLDSLKYASLPDKYRSSYTAPEITDAWSSLNDTLDTYAIGMILYQVYNDGKLPFEGQAGQQELPPPLYADYEMAEIILKAIDPNPELRWSDPMLMGQALVAYMQRNTVNDVSIVPLPDLTPKTPMPAPAEPVAAEEEAVPVEESSETPAQEQAETDPGVTEDGEALSDDAELLEELVLEDEFTVETFPTPDQKKAPADELTDLSFMDEMVSDETTPDSQTTGEVEYSELSNETSDMLSLADELIAMETPEPVVAPEPIDIPIPAPIVLADEPEEVAPTVATVSEESETAAPSEDNVVDEGHKDETVAEELPSSEEAQPEKSVEVSKEEADEEDEEDEEEVIVPVNNSGSFGKIMAVALTLIFLASIAFGCYYYYNNHYLQTVDALHLEGDANNLIVVVESEVNENLLTVVCTDTYGTTRQANVVNGKAVFENLDPDTIYQIKVVIDGFHELKGDITEDYTTPPQTNIVRFDAVPSSEPGSVVLNFTIDGKDSNSWTITYTAEGEAVNSVTFSGHLVTINGLALNKEYTFTLTGADSMYIVGNDTTTFTASAPVYAENLEILSCDANGLVAAWTAPEGAAVENWTVHCYNDAGYDVTVTTTDLTYTFTDIDLTKGYTVEVIAEGMSSGVRDYVSANCATVTGFQSDDSIPMELTVTWEYSGVAPQAGWLVLYKLQDTDQQQVIQTTENTVTITNAMPGGTYEFQIQAADGTTVYCDGFSCTAAEVEVFSGYGLKEGDWTVFMLPRPDKNGWTINDVNLYSDPRSSFAPGEKMALIISLMSTAKLETSNDLITTLYVIRDPEGNLVSCSSSESSWVYMWNGTYCTLDVPSIPTEAGSYTINLYFNRKAITQLEFEVTAE